MSAACFSSNSPEYYRIDFRHQHLEAHMSPQTQTQSDDARSPVVTNFQRNASPLPSPHSSTRTSLDDDSTNTHHDITSSSSPSVCHNFASTIASGSLPQRAPLSPPSSPTRNDDAPPDIRRFIRPIKAVISGLETQCSITNITRDMFQHLDAWAINHLPGWEGLRCNSFLSI